VESHDFCEDGFRIDYFSSAWGGEKYIFRNDTGSVVIVQDPDPPAGGQDDSV